MLQISDRQLAGFESQASREVVPRIAAHLRSDFSRDVYRWGINANLEGVVYSGVMRARRYGFEADDDLRLFCEAMMMVSPSFDETEPWAIDLFASKLTGFEKATLLHDHLVFGA